MRAEPERGDSIAAARAAFVAALAAGDAAAAGAAYAEDARLLPPSSEPVEGREAIAAFWQAGLEAGIDEVELETLALERADGFAIEVGRYALLLRPAEGDGAVVDRGKYLLVHRLQDDGSWRRAVEMFTPDGPPAREEATELPRPGGSLTRQGP